MSGNKGIAIGCIWISAAIATSAGGEEGIFMGAVLGTLIVSLFG